MFFNSIENPYSYLQPLQICKCITFVFFPVYKIQTLVIKQPNKQQKERQVSKGQVHNMLNSFLECHKRCELFIVIVSFVGLIK